MDPWLAEVVGRDSRLFCVNCDYRTTVLRDAVVVKICSDNRLCSFFKFLLNLSLARKLLFLNLQPMKVSRTGSDNHSIYIKTVELLSEV